MQRGYTYDTLGRLNGLTAAARFATGTATVIQGDQYGFDANGNVANIIDTVASQRQCFGYDTRNRLTTAHTQANTACAGMANTGPDPYERTYAYDVLSRQTGWTERTATTQTPTAHAYSYTATTPGGCTPGTPAGKPHAPTTMTGLGAYSAYDCTGNVLTRTISGGTAAGTYTLTWTPDGRMATSTESGVTSKNVYGPGGARIIRKSGNTRTLYLPSQQLTSISGATATMERSYTAGPAGPAVAIRRTGTNTGLFYLGGDAQGSASWMIKDSTTTPTATRYYPYGAVRGAANNLPTDRGFLGQIEDDHTGLNYLNNRYHDPTTGTFISVDPLVSVTGEPYLYASGNSTTLSDPLGLDPGWAHDTDPCNDNGYYSCNTLTKGPHAGQSVVSGYGPRALAEKTGSITQPSDSPVVYDNDWFLFPDTHGGAAVWMDRLQRNPNDYFPFTVVLEECAGYSCARPISVGNVLLLTPLSGLLPGVDAGRVLVTAVSDTSYTFLSLDDHKLAAGGTITFEMFDRQFEDGADVWMRFVATESASGIEKLVPEFLLPVAAQYTWSPMVAAFRCEQAYVGQEEYRRC